MRKQMTLDEQMTMNAVLRKSANHDDTMWRNIEIGAAVVGVVVLAIILLAGCAPTHDTYLATRFEAFNEDVQAGLADCVADPNECRRVLEWVAPETQRWSEVLGDPNL